ncbi:MAG: patatin-like phospholipase family protein [Deltaproteobacteria bacterium]|nr:patatin-like phospholipase family protein [Deltaproteobacteria bacterium]
MNRFAHHPEQPIGLVLSGGGARGAFQAGVWHTLYTDPRGLRRQPDVISGTSAGALNGALIAAGLKPAQILDFWLDLADRPPVVANEHFFRSLGEQLLRLAVREPTRSLSLRKREALVAVDLLRKHSWYRESGRLAMLLEFLMTARFDNLSSLLAGIQTSYLFSTEPVRERIAKAIGARELRDTPVRLAINTVDIQTGKVVRIVNHKPDKAIAASGHYRYEPVLSLDMILASASIPILFNPVQVGTQTLWDGGVLVNTPLAPAVALGARRIVPVLVTMPPNHAPQPVKTMGNAIERLADSFLENAYNTDRKLLLDRNELARRHGDPNLREIELLRAIRPDEAEPFDAGSYLYFERHAMLAMYTAGQRAAERWLARGAEVDGRNLE